MQVAFHYTDGVANATNVIHVKCTESSGLVEADVTYIATHIAAAWDTFWKVEASHVWSITTYDILYAHIEGAPNVSRQKLADATVGSIGDASDFANCCYLINWSVGDPRRGGKPRSYLPGVPVTSDADSANIVAGRVTTISAAAVTFVAACVGITHGALTTVGLVDYSKVNGKAYRLAGVTYPIVTGNCNGVVGTQRRRVDRVRG
jgi:hypothetical protein